MEIVIALLMFVDHEMKEHRIQPSMSVCLKGKREASRQLSDNIEYKCIKTTIWQMECFKNVGKF